ncbi:hypothetical protein DPM19_23265 [Actinomadura craniellae]|uniref:Uncharacterized protein n=1 Tax=Actinomadura craniellae TaxID=2231787 RepID=A0A365H1G9_9ACTN|nr:hypothetical protein [Actinomadura craniellae]RAY12932.1 hypothetical protein DPM19_23265 [Actinomadura craniellae]
MNFVLNGRIVELDAATVRARVRPNLPEPIRTHWVEIDGRRWPPKQAFRVATGLTDEPFISHFALRVFQRLGFATSSIPGKIPQVPQQVVPSPMTPHTGEDALEAFRRLDLFLASNALTPTLAVLEAKLDGIGKAAAADLVQTTGFDEDLVDAALVVRERVGMLDTLIHAAVITQALAMILEDDEVVTKRPSLGAGNDPGRVFDLETTHRVAEFKLSSWKGHDGTRQRGLFADVVGLSLDATDRRRQVFVIGELPVAFLTTSKRNAVKTLSKGPLRIRDAPGLTETMTVSEFTTAANIEVIDLRSMMPGLR